jgi:hypothetical protein
MSRKEALHKMAPGYRPTGLLVPTSSSKGLSSAATTVPEQSKIQTSASGIEELNEGMSSLSTVQRVGGPIDPLDDFVNQLEAMDGRR